MSDIPISALSQIKFWLLLILSIPSLLCSILILVHLYQQKNNLSIHHHLTFLLTAISFLQVTTQIPLQIAYFRRGEVIPATYAFCTWWSWWEYSLNGVSRFVMAWGSIERHILIFYAAFVDTRAKRLVFHQLPTFISFIFPLLFYFIAIVFNSCEQHWNYKSNICGASCYITNRSYLFLYDVIGTIVVPVLIIFTANLFLICRVVYQKRQHHVDWRRQRKLTIQLLSVALVYLIFWFPLVCISLVYIFESSYSSLQLQENYLVFLLYMVPLFLPFILLNTLPELIKKIFRKQQRVIRPA